MARIRSIKPAFFRHIGLYEAEQETSLPLRVAFAGLWTAADREGRFRWTPRELKLDCLPYDDVDFSRVLDALATRGFIVKYTVDGRDYGHIPSWKEHQVINNREAASEIPDPAKANENNTLTCATRVDDACPARHGVSQGEREREGEQEKKDAAPDGAQRSVQERELFTRGKQVLGSNAGGLIARLLKCKGSIAETRAAIEIASVKMNPREYIGRILAGEATGPPERGIIDARATGII